MMWPTTTMVSEEVDGVHIEPDLRKVEVEDDEVE